MYEVDILAVDGYHGLAVTFGTARRGRGGAIARPGPVSVLNVTVHPSTASVPVAVLPLLCGFYVFIEGLML